MSQLSLHVLLNCWYSCDTYKKKKKFKLKKEFLFCENLKTITAAKDVMNLIKNFLGKHDISIKKFGYVCTAGAGLYLIANRDSWHCKKNVNQNLIIIRCILIRYALTSKIMPDNLKEEMDPVVHVVNFIRGRATNQKLFKCLCEEMEAEYTALLFHPDI